MPDISEIYRAFVSVYKIILFSFTSHDIFGAPNIAKLLSMPNLLYMTFHDPPLFTKLRFRHTRAAVRNIFSGI